MSFTVSGWAAPYIGIPYVDGGRARKPGLDCWGLVLLVYREVFGIELPEFKISAENYREVARAMADGVLTPDYFEVKRHELRDGDGIMMLGHAGPRLARAEVHVGLFVSPRHVLHVERSCATVCEQIISPTIAFRLGSFYRHRKLAGYAGDMRLRGNRP